MYVRLKLFSSHCAYAFDLMQITADRQWQCDGVFCYKHECANT